MMPLPLARARPIALPPLAALAAILALSLPLAHAQTEELEEFVPRALPVEEDPVPLIGEPEIDDMVEPSPEAGATPLSPEPIPESGLTAEPDAPSVLPPSDPGANVIRALPVDVLPDDPADQAPAPALSRPALLPGGQPLADSGEPLQASPTTLSDARTLSITLPAPRGLIVDRRGEAFAQNKVIQQLAIVFPHLPDATDGQILTYGQRWIAYANELLDTNFSLSPQEIVTHFKNRRWLPLVISRDGNLKRGLDESELEKVQPHIGDGTVGLYLVASYQRTYPQDRLASHILGWVGKRRNLPLGEVVDGDPLYEEMAGRSGIEQSYDEHLTGTPGVINALYDSDGTKLTEDLIRRPIPGNTVVLSLDMRFQSYAQAALRAHIRAGAFVVVHVKTGDILAMESWPSFDLNEFVPGISSARYKELQEDSTAPLYARAFQGEYPPASTYKLITAMAGLESGKLTKDTYLNCPSSLAVGNHNFRNWHTGHEGSMNVIRAITRSNNVFFYQAGWNTGGTNLISMANRLGFGQRVGLPIPESVGIVPDDAYMQRRHGRHLMKGDIYQVSIGQGDVLATPLQVAQAMAGIADGRRLPQLRLVRHVQDVQNVILEENEIRERWRLDFDPENQAAVVQGMVDVVSGSGGTGRGAAISEASIAGKTGTGQWKPHRKQNLAWFTGFVPAHNPVYAYACLYEGAPGEGVSGGAKAAPVVKRVFTNIYTNAEIDDAVADGPAIPVVETQAPPPSSEPRPSQTPPPPAPVAAPEPEPQPEAPGGVRGFFRRVFSRGD